MVNKTTVEAMTKVRSVEMMAEAIRINYSVLQRMRCGIISVSAEKEEAVHNSLKELCTALCGFVG